MHARAGMHMVEVGLVARIVVLVVLFGATAVAAEQPKKVVPGSTAEVQYSFAPLVRQVAPAVANIYAKRVVQGRRRSMLFDDPFFRRFFGEDLFSAPGRSQVQNSLGSGVIVKPDGLIVTNNHVIAGATEITVVLSDRREFEAEIVLTDEKTDIAILRVDGKAAGLQHLEFADSDDLEVGDLVLAIGNPFGVGQTVTSGIVSALARTNVSKGGPQAFIQTDAAINPGNSGGALVTMDGRLVGINTAIFSKSGGSHGIGFAIPANLVSVVVDSAVKGGRIVRPWFGAAGQPVTADIAESLGLRRPIGILVKGLYPGGPAEAAGFRIGDVITAVNGRSVDDVESLKFRIATLTVDTTATIDVLRRGKQKSLQLKLRPAPEDPPRDLTKLAGSHPMQGAEVANLSPALAEELEIDTMANGVIVTRVKRGSAAHRLRFRPGDIILRLNDDAVEEVDQLIDLLERSPKNWQFRLRRGEQVLNFAFRS